MADAEDTLAAAKRKKHADYMRKYNQRNGAVAVKGTAFICTGCANEFPKVDVKQIRCAPCRDTYRREFARARRLRVGHTPIGATLKCKNCSAEFRKEFKRHFYCAACTKLSEAEMLPHQVENTRRRNADFQRNRRREVPKWGIASRMSAGISNSLRDGKQGRSWESLVGYTVTDLMAHLEERFLPGMSWDNRGEWHIDHRRPLASFNFDTPDCPDFKTAWSLENLQPLWALDNIRKSAKWVRTDVDKDEGASLIRRVRSKRRQDQAWARIQCGDRTTRYGSGEPRARLSHGGGGATSTDREE